MAVERRNKMTLLAAIGLLALTLAGTPARADHEADLVTPLVTPFVSGALLNYGLAAQHYQHYYHYRSHGPYARQRGHGPDQDVVTMISGKIPESAGGSR
jgi:hypothetical protein